MKVPGPPSWRPHVLGLPQWPSFLFSQRLCEGEVFSLGIPKASNFSQESQG